MRSTPWGAPRRPEGFPLVSRRKGNSSCCSRMRRLVRRRRWAMGVVERSGRAWWPQALGMGTRWAARSPAAPPGLSCGDEGQRSRRDTGARTLSHDLCCGSRRLEQVYCWPEATSAPISRGSGMQRPGKFMASFPRTRGPC